MRHKADRRHRREILRKILRLSNPVLRRAVCTGGRFVADLRKREDALEANVEDT
jgi:hypothetical protein